MAEATAVDFEGLPEELKDAIFDHAIAGDDLARLTKTVAGSSYHLNSRNSCALDLVSHRFYQRAHEAHQRRCRHRPEVKIIWHITDLNFSHLEAFVSSRSPQWLSALKADNTTRIVHRLTPSVPRRAIGPFVAFIAATVPDATHKFYAGLRGNSNQSRHHSFLQVINSALLNHLTPMAASVHVKRSYSKEDVTFKKLAQQCRKLRRSLEMA